MRAGLWAARYAIVCLPRPALPPVTRMTLPSRLPMSVAGLKPMVMLCEGYVGIA